MSVGSAASPKIGYTWLLGCLDTWMLACVVNQIVCRVDQTCGNKVSGVPISPQKPFQKDFRSYPQFVIAPLRSLGAKHIFMSIGSSYRRCHAMENKNSIFNVLLCSNCFLFFYYLYVPMSKKSSNNCNAIDYHKSWNFSPPFYRLVSH